MMVEGLVIMLCLALNALLAGAEMAFVLVSRPLLRERARQGDTRAALLLGFREKPERTLSVIQIGITLVAAVAAAVGGAGAEEQLSPSLERVLGVSEATADTLAISLVVIPLTYFTVVLGELVPKSLALRHSLPFALRIAPWLSLFHKVFGPIVTLLERSTHRVLTILTFWGRRKRLTPHSQQVSPEPSEGEKGASTLSLDALTSQHRQSVLNLMALEQRTVNDILLPWQNVVTIDRTLSAEAVEAVVIASGHTRLPVVTEKEILGILNTKEFRALRASNREDWVSLVRSPIRLQTTAALLTSLRLLQAHRMHMGIVYSGERLIGIVTLEDIIEEVIGDIYDEDDDGTLKRLLSTQPRTLSAGHLPGIQG